MRIFINRGALIFRAENIPIEPDSGNAVAGKCKSPLNINQIIMKRVLFFFMVFLYTYQLGAQIVFSGKVSDENQQVLAGANVVVKQSFLAASTNMNGEFEFVFPKSGKYTIEISFLGYNKLITQIELFENTEMEFILQLNDILTDEVLVLATRAGTTTPFAYSTIDREEIIEKNNFQDIPYLLKNTVSLITSSDAGTGVGYTSLRIRGSDLSRINVTVNGVPLNDSESHGVWWVNMPDFAQSVNSIQIQRGVGTSTNGAGAFGASLNFQTNQLNREAYAAISSEIGTFNTLKTNITFGTGLLNGKYSVDGRLSKLKSDGFIDRAYSDMESYYISAAYFSKKTMLRAIHFGGREKTYLAWWGVPKVRLENDLEGMNRYEEHYLYTAEQTEHMLYSDKRTYNYYTYDDETDNYLQKHTHLILSHQFSNYLNFNLVGHYTHGDGYYEQYKISENFSDYGLSEFIIGSESISSTDLVRRKNLGNDFYGFTYNLEYSNSKIHAFMGGAWNQYLGSHFGTIIWAENAQYIPINYQWYNNRGIKTDFNFFAKIDYEILAGLNVYADIQFRQIGYKIYGNDDDLRVLSTDTIYNFVNPKVGLFYKLSDNSRFYLSYAIANREPSRNEFTDAEMGEIPLPETLYDIELGYKFSSLRMAFEMNFYYMDYKNQLVQTGELNNVGNAIMTNIPESYRSGVEIVGGVKLPYGFEWNGNVTLSQNKALNYTSYTDNWDYWNDPTTEDYQIQTFFESTNLSFSPNLIVSGNLIYRAPKIFSFSCEGKYIGLQYIDNTSSLERSLKPYFTRDMHFMFDISSSYFDKIRVKLSVFNILNQEYETNAWVYRYFYQDNYYNMDGYFPQANRHFSLGLALTF